MNNDPAATERALFAAALGVLAQYAKGNLEDLAGRLAELVDAAQGDGLPGTRDVTIPPRQLDAVQRRGVIVNVLRAKGRLTSGELARLALCSDETARLTLGDLTRKGVLRRVGKKRASHYLPGPQFPRAAE